MPWAEKRANGQYRAVWRNAAGQQRSKGGFSHKAAAVRYAGEQEGKTRRGENVQGGRSMTWGQWRDRWLEQRGVEDSTASTDQGRIDRHLTPKWGKVRLASIRRADVQAWVRELAATETGRPRTPDGDEDEDAAAKLIAPATVARIYSTFAASMTAAMKAEEIPFSPCMRIELPTAAPGHERFLTRGEFDEIVDMLAGPYQLAAKIAAATGLRLSEVLGLHWQRVDLDNGVIDVVEVLNPTTNSVKGYPKGRKRRGVPIPLWLHEPLQAALEQHGAGKSCGMPHAAGSARCTSALVVALPDGRPLDRDNLRNREWLPAVELADRKRADAGIDPIGHVRWHDLRHSYASWLIQDGVSLQTVCDLLGHASVLVTQRYAHLATTQHDRVRQVLDNYTRDSAPVLPPAARVPVSV
jgi:integrase